MNRTILPAFIIATMIFTCCKKERTCNCTIDTFVTTTVSGPGMSPTTTTRTTNNSKKIIFEKARKKDAKSACVSYKQNYHDGTTTSNGYTYYLETNITGDCKLE